MAECPNQRCFSNSSTTDNHQLDFWKLDGLALQQFTGIVDDWQGGIALGGQAHLFEQDRIQLDLQGNVGIKISQTKWQSCELRVVSEINCRAKTSPGCEGYLLSVFIGRIGLPKIDDGATPFGDRQDLELYWLGNTS